MAQHHTHAAQHPAFQFISKGSQSDAGNQAGQHGFAYINENYQQRPAGAVAADKVGQTCVAAAMAAHIVVEHRRNADGAVVIAQKVTHQSGDNQCVNEHQLSSLSPFCRMVIRMGVPLRPKTSRIWFSRYRW